MTTMFAITGTLLSVVSRAHNQGKVRRAFLLSFYGSLTNYLRQPPRYGIDDWDKMMMHRDRELTGHKRGQSVCLSVYLYTFPHL